jgi:hypothetical protein
MQERLELQRAAELEHQRERAMVDEVVARILAENQMEADAKRRKQEETKAYIQAFLVQREAELLGRKRAAAEEERKIQEYWDMVGGAGVGVWASWEEWRNVFVCVGGGGGYATEIGGRGWVLGGGGGGAQDRGVLRCGRSQRQLGRLWVWGRHSGQSCAGEGQT